MKLSAGLVNISLIIVCFLCFELFIRIAAPMLSDNVSHIYKIPDIAVDLSKKNNAVLFLGNSLIGNALNLDEFDKQMNMKVSSYKVVPDGTSLWDWYCIVKNNFINNDRLPKVVVVGYAWRQAPPVSTRLGGFFCSTKDLPELISFGMWGGADVIEFLFSKASKLYVMREAIRKRVFDMIIPGYRKYTQIVNDERNATRSIKQLKKEPEDYRLLRAYIEMLVANDIKPVIVAMPVMQNYKLDKDLFRVVSKNGGVVLDYRGLDGIDKDMFIDAIHLNERGSKVFTNHLARDLRGFYENMLNTY